MRIVINKGHYPGVDPGAVNQITGLQEVDVAYEIGDLVMYYLQQVGHEVLVVQDDDLQVVCDQSNKFNAEVFVSIHCNSASVSSAKGTETWYCDGSIKGESLARFIQSQIVNSLKTVDRGVKDAVPHQDGLYVLSNTNAVACLVETAFINNADDEKLLASERGKDDFARAIARGITDYAASL